MERLCLSGLITFSKYVSDPLIDQAEDEDVKQLFLEEMWPLLTCLQLQRLELPGAETDTAGPRKHGN